MSNCEGEGPEDDDGEQSLHGSGAAPASSFSSPCSASNSPPLCPRCAQQPAATVHRQQPLCRSCFLSTFTTRFRQTLRRRCGVETGSRVLVGWSGGLSSSVLCELLREARWQEEGRRRLLLHVEIAHIDCSAITQQPPAQEERDGGLRHFRPAAQHVLPLSAVFDIPQDSQPPLTPSSPSAFIPADCEHRAAADARLRQLFLSVPAAFHQSLLSHLLAHLLSFLCRLLRCSCLLTAQSATSAASAVIAAIVKGQGRRAACSADMAEQRMQTRWAFPLRDSSAAHIAYYFHFHRLTVLSSLAPIRLQRTASSSLPPSSAATLDSASAAFISRLEAQYRQTVSNVLRTVEKIDRPPLTAATCAMCGLAAEEAAVSSALSCAASSQRQRDSSCPPSPCLCYDCERGLCSLSSSSTASLQLLPLCVLHAECRQRLSRKKNSAAVRVRPSRSLVAVTAATLAPAIQLSRVVSDGCRAELRCVHKSLTSCWTTRQSLPRNIAIQPDCSQFLCWSARTGA